MTHEKGRNIRVFIIDGSATQRQVLKHLAAGHPGVEIAGTAPNPMAGRDKIKQTKPDVLLLNAEAVRMKGFTLLRNMLHFRPTPVIMISSAGSGTAQTIDWPDPGSVDFIAAPSGELKETPAYRRTLLEKIQGAAARSRSWTGIRTLRPGQPSGPAGGPGRTEVIAIGASTGGTEAIREILQSLPQNMPPILIAQHIPENLSVSFAGYLNRHSPLTVLEASDGQPLVRGQAYVAPGNRHLLLDREDARYVCRVNALPAVRRHRPSIDLLFESLADKAGAGGAGVILTGMGDDGSAGLRRVHDAGGPTIAQDEGSSVIWGMPAEAVRNGAARQVMPLAKITERLIELGAGARG